MTAMQNTISGRALKARKDIRDFKSEIDIYVQKDLAELKGKYSKEDEIFQYGLEIFADITTREAKRVRAAFVYKVAEMFGYDNKEAMFEVGAIIEYFHAYILMMDDYADLSRARRGGPTVHEMFTNFHIKNKYQGDADHYGKAMATTLGITVNQWAQGRLGRLQEKGVDPQTTLAVAKNLSDMYFMTGYGQFIDITNVYRPAVSEEVILKMLTLKTSTYTYQNPINTGLLLAGITDEKIVAALDEYALHGGLSFQIQDDILGMFGEPGKTGKSDMDDLSEGKYTLLVWYVLEHGSTEDKELLQSGLGKRESLTVETHAAVKDMMMQNGALQYSIDSARKYRDKAVAASEGLRGHIDTPEFEAGLDYLAGLADYIIERAS